MRTFSSTISISRDSSGCGSGSGTGVCSGGGVRVLVTGDFTLVLVEFGVSVTVNSVRSNKNMEYDYVQILCTARMVASSHTVCCSIIVIIVSFYQTACCQQQSIVNVSSYRQQHTTSITPIQLTGVYKHPSQNSPTAATPPPPLPCHLLAHC